MRDAMRDLSQAITLASDFAFSKNAEATLFPTLTVPLFESRASHTRQQSGFASVGWAPIVTHENVPLWLNFTHNEQWWLHESREFDLATEHNLNREDYTYGEFIDFIYSADIDPETRELIRTPETGSGPFAPLWCVLLFSFYIFLSIRVCSAHTDMNAC